MPVPAAPEGYATVNPFIITRDAEELTRFVVEVFGGAERPEARTVDAADAGNPVARLALEPSADGDGVLTALRGPGVASVQGHLESVLSSDGIGVLEALARHALGVVVR